MPVVNTSRIWLLLFIGGASFACDKSSASRKCEKVECVRAVICHRGSCDGPVTQSGCCPCEPGDIDEADCPTKAPEAGSVSDAT
jgi:hypothetical protein